MHTRPHIGLVDTGEGSIWVLPAHLQVGVGLAKEVLLVQSDSIACQFEHFLAVSHLLGPHLSTEKWSSDTNLLTVDRCTLVSS